MNTHHRMVMVGLGLALLGLCSCWNRGLNDHHRASWTSEIILSVVPGQDGKYTATTTQPAGPNANLFAYPGVTCYLANGRILITSAVVSPDGKTLTLSYTNNSGLDFGMVWVLLDPGTATLATLPTVDGNFEGDKVFVIGPLANGASRTLTLDLTAFDAAGYVMAMDFLDVRPRIAYSSDRAFPADEWVRTLYSYDATIPDLFTVTPGSTTRDLNPVWSPGGEWIAYERMTPTIRGDGSRGLPTQINLVHPDGTTGGYGGQISQGLYLTSFANFNPSGDLMAYAGRLYDESNPDTTYNVYLYDIKTRTQKIWFPGAPYFASLICNPKWSPDGKHLIMNTMSSTGVIRWMYARVDPLTGDTVPIYDSLGNRVAQPVAWMSNGLVGTLPGVTTKHQLQMWDWNWAPDSRHVAVQCTEFIAGVNVFAGQGIIDFQAILDLPAENMLHVPDAVTPVAYGGDGECLYAGFNAAATQMWYYQSTSNTNSILQFTPLTNYAATTPHERVDFLSDGFYNFTAALWRPALPEFFPPGP